MHKLTYGVFEVHYEVRRFDTVDVTVYLVIPPEILARQRKVDPVGIVNTYVVGRATFSPGKDSRTFEADHYVGTRELPTGFNAWATVTLDVAKATLRLKAKAELLVLGKTVAGSPWEITKSWTYSWAPVLPIGTAQIAHVVVVMLENRSFDNLAGWLYHEEGNRPPRNIPHRDAPTYDGLEKDTYWNPRTAAWINKPDQEVPEDPRVYVTQGTQSWIVPAPDPLEQFRHMNYQIFGTERPEATDVATMKGFVVNYAAAIKESGGHAADPGSIMECFSPEQLGVLSTLARSYAISDRWCASAPCQTWPNRGFMHAGTSCGRVNNLDKDTDDNTPPDPGYYDTKTIFNVLKEVGVSWKVYGDSILPTLTWYQFATQLSKELLPLHFRSFDAFKNDATLGTLPSYSFVEPDFMIQRNDQHPPHDVRKAETFLYEIWKAISEGPAWNNTLLIITYDEHGGCFDHVPPPRTAVAPDNSKPQKPFGFDRYGVRVATILVSPWIEPGTVFRSGSQGVEFDHTSILATLRDWQDLESRAAKGWLASKRIAAAPTLGCVLTRAKPRTEKPLVPAPPPLPPQPPDSLLDSLQRAILAAALIGPGDFSAARYKAVAEEVAKLRTLREAVERLRKLGLAVG